MRHYALFHVIKITIIKPTYANGEVKEVKEVRALRMIPYGPTDGHPLNNQRASTEQALGTHYQHGGATNAQL